MTKTSTSSYGPSASRINVSRELILLKTRQGCACERRSMPCPTCAEIASAEHWQQLTARERVEFQTQLDANVDAKFGKADMSCFGW
jgi:hypothetical protein